MVRSWPPRVLFGALLHFAFATFIAFTFFGIIGAAAWLAISGLRTWAEPVALSVIGTGIVYVINRWAILPPDQPDHGVRAARWFFVAHIAFGITVGIVRAMALRRRTVLAAMPRVGPGGTGALALLGYRDGRPMVNQRRRRAPAPALTWLIALQTRRGAALLRVRCHLPLSDTTRWGRLPAGPNHPPGVSPSVPDANPTPPRRSTGSTWTRMKAPPCGSGS